jgi:peroxiredoxin Q/BCP
VPATTIPIRKVNLDPPLLKIIREDTRMLEQKQPAPEFALPNQDHRLVTLSEYRGNKNVVLYFYPRDDTPGCTIEANEFTALVDEFGRRDIVVIGVSKDSCDSHRAFRDKYGFRVELLADTTGEVCERYGVWQEKEKNGVKKMGLVRSTFLIDKQGMLVEALYGVTAEGHAQDMLDRARLL